MLRGKRIGIIGVGNMGEAIVRGLQKKGFSEGIAASDVRPDRRDSIKKTYGLEVFSDSKQLASQVDIVIVAVKPQDLRGVLEEISSALDPSKILISIVAGASLATISSILGQNLRLIRAMPNIAALVLESATALSQGGEASAEDMEVSQEIFDALGRTVILPETLMDAVTGMSGSGPAYVCLIIEALADGGVRMGLPRREALELATQTVLGTSRLLLEQGIHPGELKDKVASPGGTTIAGIASLEARGVRGAMIEAVISATQRSKELSKIAG